MTENKQINKIARGMCHLSAECKTCKECNEKYHGEEGELCYFQHIAKEIISHDYRKASEVAQEIFEEIEKILDKHSMSYHKVGEIYGEYYDGAMQFDIAKLKKKYTEEQNN